MPVATARREVLGITPKGRRDSWRGPEQGIGVVRPCDDGDGSPDPEAGGHRAQGPVASNRSGTYHTVVGSGVCSPEASRETLRKTPLSRGAVSAI